MTIEAQMDTLVGPTHFYGGLSFGNVASMAHVRQASNPKKAALQGLEKMKLVSDLGARQLVLPPHPRPLVSVLCDLGFQGSEQEVLEAAYKMVPELLMQCSSQSAMWTANAATWTPSTDSTDGKVHITPANLSHNLHRSLETAQTQKVLKQVFKDPRYFIHHPPLPSSHDFADEGAANYTRFLARKKGLHLFVYGRDECTDTRRYPARQTRRAEEAIVRRHMLKLKQVVFAEQNPLVIDQGVFHNDVIAVGHEDLFFLHEEAYTDTKAVIKQLRTAAPLTVVEISKNLLTVKEAVASYIFNSQIVTTASGKRVIICPTEVEEMARAKAIVENKLPVDQVLYVALNQSMKNGGGPACLRLRLPLTEQELQAIHPFVFFTNSLYEELKLIIETHYPDRFLPKYLLDRDFRRQCKKALKEIMKLLQLEE